MMPQMGLVARSLALATAALLPACGVARTTPVGTPTLPASTSTSGPVRSWIGFNFTTLDDRPHVAFNRLTGINNNQRITGYYGSSPSHPINGYLVYPPYGKDSFRQIGYPEASQTIVTSLNNRRMVAGSYVVAGRTATLGFLWNRGLWWTYVDPRVHGKGAVTAILGLNDAGIAVGYFRSPAASGAFELDVATGVFKTIAPPTGSDPVATAISGTGDIVGYLSLHGKTMGWLLHDKVYKEFSFPGAIATEFLGITIDRQIVGSFVDRAGVTYGFLLIHPLFTGIEWEKIDEPNAVGTTVVTSINIHDDIVGYYLDSNGVNHGFLGTPK